MAADSGRLREACDPAHTGSGTRSIQVIACLSVLLTGFWHGDPAHKYFSANPAWQDCLEPVSNRSLADAPAGLRHGTPVHRCLCGIPAWRSGLQSTLRHSDPTHRYFRGIYAWRDHLLSTLLSRDPAHRYSRAISPWRSSHLSVHSSMKWALFVDVEVRSR